jgi:hypothetical protein
MLSHPRNVLSLPPSDQVPQGNAPKSASQSSILELMIASSDIGLVVVISLLEAMWTHGSFKPQILILVTAHQRPGFTRSDVVPRQV